MSQSSTSSKELCIACLAQPYDLTCTCGGKFDFACINLHAMQIRAEYEFVHGETGERLLQVEHAAENKDCTSTKIIIENWRQKRIQDINDIADDALNQTQHTENACLDVGSFRTQYAALSEHLSRVVHEQLDAIHSLQRQIQEKLDQLENLPELLQDDRSLDTQLQSKLNPNIFNQNSTIHVIEAVTSVPVASLDRTTSTTTELSPMAAPVVSLDKTTEPSPIAALPTYVEPPRELVNNDLLSSSTKVTQEHDDFDAGRTVNIQRENPIIISITHDNFVGTVCCHDNQLLYNDYNQITQNYRLTFVRDLTQPTIRQIIDWNDSDRSIDGDDKWVQDIAYSTKLKGYLLLTRSSLRVLYDQRNQLEGFHEFPDRKMKRVTCNDRYIYLIVAADPTSHNGDEIIMMNYDKEENICKTFRDIVLNGRTDLGGTHVGEISDLAVNMYGQIMLAYRLKLHRQVRVCTYNVSNDGQNWTIVKQLLLNECWNDDVSYTPRMEWCEKLNVFFLIEYITSHLIMLDKNGQVKGECRFMSVQNRQESPLNLTISTDDKLCLRYESSINIHQIIDDRF
ncbi:unnamed protein product [Rotaria sp. Silwood2]|nr:unnamed protein product [Rotaria sp. Silwood2]CAF3916835.1 unnamed protein product [Rotaria sp. Silwood2]CAF3940563.1 unnamed protein product [Rotaria sp. Silwood2]